MNNVDVDICIIGGGPAGMTAALEAVKIGIPVLLIDERTALGGQIFRQFPYGFQINEDQLDKKYLDKDYLDGQKFIKEIDAYKDKFEILSDSLVWGIFPEREIAYIRDEKNKTFTCKKLILAEGVYERPLPFPGWTLPGVISAGGAQSLVKTQRVLPGKKILLSGTGPLQLVLANQLISAGAEVVAVLEASSTMGFKHLTKLWKNLSLVKEGLGYLNNLRKAGVPFLRAHAIVEASGEESVSGAKYAQLDKNWAPIAGTEKEVEIDTICVGYGFISSTRLSHYCGCDHRYDSMLRSWVPNYNEDMETSVDGIFVAGDCAGVAGHLVAIEEGRIAGIRASQQLGAIPKKEADERSAPIYKKLKSLRDFEAALNEMTAIRPGLFSRIRDDTLVCRCEEITAGDIKKCIPSDAHVDLNEIKRMTRAGMGDCQGRMCASIIAEIACQETELTIEQLGTITYRPPAKPIPLSAFLEDE